MEAVTESFCNVSEAAGIGSFRGPFLMILRIPFTWNLTAATHLDLADPEVHLDFGTGIGSNAARFAIELFFEVSEKREGC